MNREVFGSLRNPAVIINAIGMVVYLGLEAHFLPYARNARGYSAGGFAVLDLLVLLPVQVLFALVNLVWLIVILFTVRRHGWGQLGDLILIVAAWLGVAFVSPDILQAVLPKNVFGRLGVSG